MSIVFSVVVALPIRGKDAVISKHYCSGWRVQQHGMILSDHQANRSLEISRNHKE